MSSVFIFILLLTQTKTRGSFTHNINLKERDMRIEIETHINNENLIQKLMGDFGYLGSTHKENECTTILDIDNSLTGEMIYFSSLIKSLVESHINFKFTF